MKRESVVLAILLLLAAAVRVAMAVTTFYTPFDSGTVGLMALHILEGDRPLFLYGHNYSGALLAYLVAICFSVGGVNFAMFFAPSLAFSLGWVVVSHRLFKEWFNARAGLAAAAVVAVPDWITMWHGIAPDCSYSPLFFLGTSALLLAARLGRRELTPRAEAAHLVALGVVAGLGLWVHFLVAPYLLLAAGLLVPCVLRRGRSWRFWAHCIAGLLGMAICLLPYRWAAVSAADSAVTSLSWSGPLLQVHWHNFLYRAVPRLLLWPVHPPAGVRFAVKAFLLLGAASYLLRLGTAEDRRDFGRALIPAIFGLLFLALYLPHRQAMEAAPRYIVPLWILTATGFTALPLSSSRRMMQWAGAVLLAAYAAYHLFGLAAYMRVESPIAAQRVASDRWLIEQARVASSDYVMMLSDTYEFMARGQSLSFLARDEIHFVSAAQERCAPAAQAADAAERPAFAAEATNRVEASEALKALSVTCQRTDANAYSFFGRPAPRTNSLRAVPAEEMSVEVLRGEMGSGAVLTDRRRLTCAAWGLEDGVGFVADLGKGREVAGLVLLPLLPTRDRLPGHALVEVSEDGRQYREVLRSRGAWPFRYVDGPRVYFGDAYGRQEWRFAPERARYIRYRVEGDPQPGGMWRVSELFVLERVEGAPPDWAGAIPQVEDEVRRRGVRFVAADRWVSARLFGRGVEVFPRYNDHYQFIGAIHAKIPRRTVAPGPAVAVVSAAWVADEQERLFLAQSGEGRTCERVDAGAYTIFFFAGDWSGVPPFSWNGLMVLP